MADVVIVETADLRKRYEDVEALCGLDLAVPKGSRLEATAHYDNSAQNKWNPDPTVDVRWGEQTWQEMQYTGITFYVDQPAGTSNTGGGGQR